AIGQRVIPRDSSPKKSGSAKLSFELLHSHCGDRVVRGAGSADGAARAEHTAKQHRIGCASRGKTGGPEAAGAGIKKGSGCGGGAAAESLEAVPRTGRAGAAAYSKTRGGAGAPESLPAGSGFADAHSAGRDPSRGADGGIWREHARRER